MLRKLMVGMFLLCTGAPATDAEQIKSFLVPRTDPLLMGSEFRVLDDIPAPLPGAALHHFAIDIVLTAKTLQMEKVVIGTGGVRSYDNERDDLRFELLDAKGNPITTSHLTDPLATRIYVDSSEVEKSEIGQLKESSVAKGQDKFSKKDPTVRSRFEVVQYEDQRQLFIFMPFDSRAQTVRISLPHKDFTVVKDVELQVREFCLREVKVCR